MAQMEGPRAGDARAVDVCGNFTDQNSFADAGRQPIHVELGERRLRSGDTVSVAACALVIVTGSRPPICRLARKLPA